MTHHSSETAKLVLADRRGLGRVQVDMEAFFEFSFGLAEDLADLVAKWSHRAAPREAIQQRNRKPLPK